MKNNVIAIDLGSSNTAIYQVGQGVVLYEPSVVAFSSEEKRKLKEVGREAKKLIGKTTDNTKVFSPIFESEIEDMEGACAMLENFLNKITLRRLSARPAVVFSVPCGAEIPAIRKFEKMLVSCDVNNYSFIESPVLTALGLGLPLTEASPCFVVNIGGGTTEIAAVSLDGVICGVSVNMGGISIDAMLQTHIEERFNLMIGSLTAEKMKIAIGSLNEADDTRMIINGRDLSTGRPRAISVSSAEISAPIRCFFDKIFEIMEMVLAKLPAEVSAEIHKKGVYFAGGVSKTVGLEDYFYDKIRMRANISSDAEMCTVLGGGIVASNKELIKKLRINKR